MKPPSLNRRAFAAILAAITLFALGLRLYRLDAESLYMDEIVTVETFHRDPLGVVLGAAIVGQPPLDNFVGALVYRIGLGHSDWWVRFPAALFGTASVLLLGVWVRRLAGAIAGLTAALLLAVCPLHAYMSQEVRPYSLMFFLALACGLSYVRACERNTAARWTFFSLVTFAMLMSRWTDPHFIVLGIGLHALLSRMRAVDAGVATTPNEASMFRRATLATMAAYAGYAPFFCIVLHYHHTASIRPPSGDWPARLVSLLYEGYAALLAGYSTRTVFHALPGSHWLLIAGGLLALIGLVAAFVRRAATAREVSVFWWIFVPFPVAYAFVNALLGDAIPKPQRRDDPAHRASSVKRNFQMASFGNFHISSTATPSGSVSRYVRTPHPQYTLITSPARAIRCRFAISLKQRWKPVIGNLHQNARAGDVIKGDEKERTGRCLAMLHARRTHNGW